MLDAASDTPTNGNSSLSRHTKPISIDGTSPSVCVSPSSPVNHHSIVVEGQKQTTFLHQDESAIKTNGHAQGDESGGSRAKFELRAFQEEKRPAKLFTPGEEQQVRVTRRRPSEEVKGCWIMYQTVTNTLFRNTATGDHGLFYQIKSYEKKNDVKQAKMSYLG